MTTTNDADNGTAVVILGWCLLVPTTTILALRLYVRLNIVRQVALHDYLMIVAWVLLLMQAVFYTVAWSHGLGRHIWTLSAEQTFEVMKYMVGYAQIFAIYASTFGRISFSLFLLVIIGTTNYRKKIVLWAVVAIQIIINTVVIVQIYAQCGMNVTALWNPAVAAHSTCQSPMVQTVLGYIQGGINAVCDLVLCIMPVTILWSLQMQLAQKIGLGAMLTLSLFAFGAAVAKTALLGNLALADLTWNISKVNLAVLVENNVVIMAASIPALRPLLVKARKGTTPTPRAYPVGGSNWQTGHSQGKYNGRIIDRGDAEPVPGDANSEEYILGPVSASEGQITKTTTFHIANEARSQDEYDPGIQYGNPLPKH